ERIEDILFLSNEGLIFEREAGLACDIARHAIGKDRLHDYRLLVRFARKVEIRGKDFEIDDGRVRNSDWFAHLFRTRDEAQQTKTCCQGHRAANIFVRRSHFLAATLASATAAVLIRFGGTMRSTLEGAMFCEIVSESFGISTEQKSARCDPG